LIWDCDGDVVVSGLVKIDHLVNAFHVMLIASLQAIQKAIDLGIGRLLVETNAKLIVQAITTNDFDMMLWWAF
jgi:hypothetical protein